MASTNPWQSFKSLLPKTARMVVTVTTVNADGTSVVTLRSGDTMLVNGDSITAGSKAWIEDGKITGPASALPYSEVMV